MGTTQNWLATLRTGALACGVNLLLSDALAWPGDALDDSRCAAAFAGRHGHQVPDDPAVRQEQRALLVCADRMPDPAKATAKIV